MGEQIQKPWGYFEVIAEFEGLTVKRIHIKAKHSLSLQSHQNRDEFWYPIRGSGKFEIENKTYHVNDIERFKMFEIFRGISHRASASSFEALTFIEVSTGDFDEEDIVRYEDDYGRASVE